MPQDHDERAEADLQRRRVPCICTRQHEADPPFGEMQSVRLTARGPVERVRCSACPRTWTRHTR